MRTYSETEVQSIIERAVERQQQAEAGAPASGLTLDEIERIGRESGIDPAHLRAAAAEVDSAGRTLSRQSHQTRTEVVVERWIDAPFRMEAWEDTVALLREHHGAPMGAAFGSTAGEGIRQIGASYEWTHTDGLGVRTRVTVSPRDGRTRLRMTKLVGLASPTAEGITYGAIIALTAGVIAAVVAMVSTDGAGSFGLVGVAAFLLLWALAAPTVTALDRRWRARMLRKLDALADDVVPVLNVRPEPVRSAAPPAESASTDELAGSARSEPALDLDALPNALDTGRDASRNRLRA